MMTIDNPSVEEQLETAKPGDEIRFDLQEFSDRIYQALLKLDPKSKEGQEFLNKIYEDWNTEHQKIFQYLFDINIKKFEKRSKKKRV